jgi:hypothetical protein
VDIGGSTRYTLGEGASTVVVEHVESWSVSGGEALLQLLRPGPR